MWASSSGQVCAQCQNPINSVVSPFINVSLVGSEHETCPPNVGSELVLDDQFTHRIGNPAIGLGVAGAIQQPCLRRERRRH